LGASFVTRRWRRLASVRLAAELERFRYAAIPDSSLAAVCPACVTQNLVGGSVTLTLSRLVTGALSVSPEDGVAWSATYRRREEQGSGRWSNELRSRLALYVRVPGLGGFAHHVVALRLLAGRVTVSYDFPLSVRLGVAQPLAAPPSGAARRLQVYAAFAADF